MGARARAATAKFSDELHARDMLDIYEYVLAQPKPDPAAVVAAVPRRRDEVPTPARRAPRGDHERAPLVRAGRSSG